MALKGERESQGASTRRTTLQGSAFSFCGRDLGRDWAVVVVAGEDCSGRQDTSGHKLGAREDRLR